MTFTSANLTSERQIASFPFVVTTLDEDTALFLQGLPTPDFGHTVETDVDWAIAATGADVGGSQYPGSAFIVSGHTFRRLQAHRY